MQKISVQKLWILLQCQCSQERDQAVCPKGHWSEKNFGRWSEDFLDHWKGFWVVDPKSCCLQSLVGPSFTYNLIFHFQLLTPLPCVLEEGTHLHITHSRFSRFSDTQRSPSFLFIIIRLVRGQKRHFWGQRDFEGSNFTKSPFQRPSPFFNSFIHSKRNADIDQNIHLEWKIYVVTGCQKNRIKMDPHIYLNKITLPKSQAGTSSTNKYTRLWNSEWFAR